MATDRSTGPRLPLTQAGWMLSGILSAGMFAPAAATPANDPAIIAQGEYITRLADCGACHTRAGGQPYAGGFAVTTPFGTVTSTNITPDKDTGIGGWSDDDFYRAVADGIAPHHQYLYPAMPFTSFTKMTRGDVLAVKAYLFTLKPIHAPAVPLGLSFPLDIRWTMIAWRELYFRPGVYQPDPARSAEWNRGAYIIEGPGHCGECHSPRNMLGATKSQDSLAGGSDGIWWAPNISSDPPWGIGKQSVGDIVGFLKTGAHDSEGVAFGPMAVVLRNSLDYMSTADLQAMAVFLKAGPSRVSDLAAHAATADGLGHGQQLYLANCAACHQASGQGASGTIANLVANAAVNTERPDDVIDIVLKGQHGVGTYSTMPGFAATLSDLDISNIVNYLRSEWGNHAPMNATTALVNSLRRRATGQD